jgi:hypothetical protein
MGKIRRYRLGIGDIAISIKNSLGTVSTYGGEKRNGRQVKEVTRCSYTSYAVAINNLDIIIGLDHISQADRIINRSCYVIGALRTVRI